MCPIKWQAGPRNPADAIVYVSGAKVAQTGNFISNESVSTML